MLAKATAREAGARFINLDIASLTDKWYGESQKLAGAVFTLAKKIQPCIIFIGKRRPDQADGEDQYFFYFQMKLTVCCGSAALRTTRPRP